MTDPNLTRNLDNYLREACVAWADAVEFSSMVAVEPENGQYVVLVSFRHCYTLNHWSELAGAKENSENEQARASFRRIHDHLARGLAIDPLLEEHAAVMGEWRASWRRNADRNALPPYPPGALDAVAYNDLSRLKAIRRSRERAISIHLCKWVDLNLQCSEPMCDVSALLPLEHHLEASGLSAVQRQYEPEDEFPLCFAMYLAMSEEEQDKLEHMRSSLAGIGSDSADCRIVNAIRNVIHRLSNDEIEATNMRQEGLPVEFIAIEMIEHILQERGVDRANLETSL